MESLLSIQAARETILAATERLPSEPVPLGIAHGRVLAEAVRAAADAPPFDNSAMDGFAVAAAASSHTLRVVGEARAGQPADVAIRDAEAVSISTGAPLPAGADAVVRVEDAALDGDRVTLAVAPVSGQNVRRAGDDLRAGMVVLDAGAWLGAAELAVAIGAGAGTIACARRPRVAVLCTGDELREPGATLGPGEIHNANATVLAALAARAGADVVAARVVRDERADTELAFAGALEGAYVVIASGGVSVGAHDHVKDALATLGVEQRFWRVDLQPGKPTWFGVRGAQLVFGLPGNPVSSFVTFLLFARPALLALQGAPPLPAHASAQLAVDVPRGARTQALRVRLDERDGIVRATPTGPQGSHVTASLPGAGALAFIEAGDGVVPAGTMVAIERIASSVCG
jgi:molybdopterin molybdotransferase